MVLLHIDYGFLPTATSLVDFLLWWEIDVHVLIPLSVILAGYVVGRWRLEGRSKYQAIPLTRVFFYLGGFIALAVALVSPVSVYSEELFFMHMIQHLLLIMVAVPLFLLSNPMGAYVWALPTSARYFLGRVLTRSGTLRFILRGVTAPVVAWIVYGGTIWIWHTPMAYNAALGSEWLHILEHLSIFGTAVFFWWPLIGPSPVRSYMPYPLRFLYVFLALFHNIILGAILTFADAPVYSYYQDAPEHWGISAAMSQQLGGVIMWIPGAMMHFAALSILFFVWIEREQREVDRWHIDQEKRRKFLGYLRAQSTVTGD